MINLSVSAEYMMMMLHFMTWTLLLCGGLMWAERKGNPRERKILASTLLVSWAMMMIRVVLTYEEGIPESYPVLPIRNLYGGYWALLLVFFYPIEAVSSGWLKWKNVLLLFAPMIVITFMLTIIPFEFIELHSWSDVMSHISEANVWFRILMLFVIIIPYMILLLFVPYNWQKSSVDVKWIRRYTIGAQGISILYILFMLTGSLTVSFLHLLYCTLFFLYVIYQELYLRLLPANTRSVSAPVEEVILDVVEPKKTPEPDANGVWKKFECYMRVEKPWLSPDITVGDLAEAIGVSRSRLSAEISAQGDDSFYKIIARYRISEFCEMAKRGEVENVNEAMFAVGFRSRSTAYDRFKEQTGMTPAEYIKTIKTCGI